MQIKYNLWKFKLAAICTTDWYSWWLGARIYTEKWLNTYSMGIEIDLGPYNIQFAIGYFKFS